MSINQVLLIIIHDFRMFALINNGNLEVGGGNNYFTLTIGFNC